MANSRPRLIPYVDITVEPRRRRLEKRRSPSPSRSTCSASSALTKEATPSSIPRKKRKLGPSVTDIEISNNFNQIGLGPLSPTASEFEFENNEQKDEGLGMQLSKLKEKGKEVSVDQADFYIRDDELPEDDDYAVHGETLSNDNKDDIPVRFLSDFVIYNLNTYEIISVAVLLQLEYSLEKYGASGTVKPWVEENEEVDPDESNDTDDEERVSLSEILEFAVHTLMESEDALDRKIYIRTKYAWYILGCPLDRYKDYFTKFWIQTQMLNLLVNAALNNNKLTYDDFVLFLANLDESENIPVTAPDIIQRSLCEDDIKDDDVFSYLVSSLPDICRENSIRISSVPIIRAILGGSYDSEQYMSLSHNGRRARKFTSRLSSNREKALLKNHNKTFLMPTVNQIAQNLFEGSLEVAASVHPEEIQDNGFIKPPYYKGHHYNPSSIVWGTKMKSYKDGLKFYESVELDGMTYTVGDVIMVEPDAESASAKVLKASQTVNKYGNRWWFCQIQYFYEKTTKKGTVKMFHGMWFVHGSKTILQETSHSKALYLLETCDDNPVISIFKKCNIKFMRPGDEEVLDDGSHNANDFHCGLKYDEEDVAFLDIPPGALDIDAKGGTCYACSLKDARERRQEIDYSQEDMIVVHGTTFHLDEFVYICSSSSEETKILDIGQIKEIQQDQVEIIFLERYDDYVNYQKDRAITNAELSYDERRLYFTDKTAIIPAHKLDGKCYVLHLTDAVKIENWIFYDDHYYFNQKGSIKSLQTMTGDDFVYCGICHLVDRKIRHQAEKFSQTNSKLVGMELFSGAGGLGVGMDLSGFVETKYAIEYSPSAAKTYQRNHPNTTVYCQDTSSLLKYAVTGINSAGSKKPLVSKMDDKTTCPPLPDRTKQVDFIFGGPPCQSFSRANHAKHRDDVRTTLACNMLSYAEYYEPNYFLLENVAGLLDHKLYTKQELDGKMVESEIQHGMVKFIMRTLIALGYQVRYKLLQAGQYGVPQSRRRVIFWGAKRGIPLPEFPVPVYAFAANNAVHRVSLPTGRKLLPVTRSINPENLHYCAPLRPRTVNDAISDLPPFDWKNPYAIVPCTKHGRIQDTKRRANDIPAFDAVNEGAAKDNFNNLPGFPDGVEYPMEPQNRYQKWLRKNMGKDDMVTAHYTTRFTRTAVEATANVPMRPHADHKDLPSSLLPRYAQPGYNKKGRTFYGRMDGKGHFRCALTILSPTLKNQWPLHPTQKRIISVREAARSQGFPDDYIFESINTKPSAIIADQLRQIGNAVAIPFALALGKELGKAMIKAWEEKEREGSVGA